MAAGRDVWVKIRASLAERAEWHAKARSAGLTLSDLVRLRGADQPSDTSMYCILSWVVWYPTSRAITAPVSACRCPWVHPSQFS